MPRLALLVATALVGVPALALAADGGSDLCSTQSCVVYASSDTDLYQVDPGSLAQTHLSTFTGLPTGAIITDIAVSTGGTVYGVTETALYSIAPATGASTLVATLSTSTEKWVCLAFTAGGTLVAADTTGDVVTINTTSGAVTTVGSFNGYGCSGDMVAIDDANHTIFASATNPSCTSNCTDLLVTLNPANSYNATVIGNTGEAEVYGLGYWAGLLYGFTHAGQTLQINPATGASTVIGTTSPAVKFSGGATTPLAPTCTNACTSGATECSGDGGLETCAMAASGCTAWTTQACPTLEACSGGACVATCTDACTDGATECSADGGLSTCGTASSGCTAWTTASCPAPQVCTVGACMLTCTDRCTSGAIQCSASGGLETCELTSNGCTDWVSSACPMGETCGDGGCYTPCTSACAAGQGQCVGNAIQQCAAEADGCFDWIDGGSCPSSQLCVNGACASTCSNACSSGAMQCAGSIIQYCDTASSGCLAWENGSDCGPIGCDQGACCTCTAGAIQCASNGSVEECVAAPADAGVCPSWVITPCPSGACADGSCLTACNPESEFGSCPSPAVCERTDAGTFCGFENDGGFTPLPTSGAGTTSATTGTPAASGSGSTTGSPTASASDSGSATTGRASGTSSGAGSFGGISTSGTAGTGAGTLGSSTGGTPGSVSSAAGGAGFGTTATVPTSAGSSGHTSGNGAATVSGCGCRSGGDALSCGLLALLGLARRRR